MSDDAFHVILFYGDFVVPPLTRSLTIAMGPLQKNKPDLDEQKRRVSSRRRKLTLIIITVVLALFLVVALVLGSLQIIPNIWATISSAVVTIFGTAFAFIALFPSEKQSEQITHIPVPVIISGGTAHTTTATIKNDVIQPHQIVVQPHTASDLQAHERKTAFRGIVGFLPPTNGRVIEQRVKTVEEVYTKLTRPDMTAMVLTGISGVGKSTLAALVYQHAELLRTANTGYFYGEPIWLTINFDTAMIDVVGTIFEKLGVILPELDQQSPQSLANELFNVLSAVDQPRLVVLDQFENLLDAQTGRVRVERPGVSEWLDVINSQLFRTGSRLLLTSRVFPKSSKIYPPVYVQEYCSEGLHNDEGISLLKKLFGEGDASEKDFLLAVERCGGHAYALTLLASLLRDHHLSLRKLFINSMYEELWEGDIAQNFLDYIYENQLEPAQRQLLQAFSVYREAVPLEAVQETIDPNAHVVRKDLLTATNILLNLHLLQSSGEGNYVLHALIAHYARHHFDVDEQRNHELLRAAHARAALYYQHLAVASHPLQGKRLTIKNIQPLIEATWQLMHAGRFSEAYAFMEREALFADLDRLGGASILLELYDLLFPLENWHATPAQTASVYKNYGRIHSRIQVHDRSLKDYEKALHLYRETGDSNGQCQVLIYLGEVWHNSDVARTLDVYLEALSIARSAGYSKHEAASLNSLSWVYKNLGELEKGRVSGEQALKIYRELEDLWGESRSLDALGEVYNALGEQEQALESFELALRLYREVGNHWQEGWMLIHMGGIYSDQGQREHAQKHYEQALVIGKRVGNRWVEMAALNNLGNISHHTGQQKHAREYYEQALQGTQEIKDTWGQGRALHNLGKFTYEQGQHREAINYLSKAFSINREIGNYLGAISTLHDVCIVYMDQNRYDLVLAVLLIIQKNYEKIQSSKLKEISTLQDSLRVRIGEEAFSGLLIHVEHNYSELVRQALNVSLQ